MSKRDSDWETDVAGGILAIGIVALVLLGFWWLKGCATIWSAFAAEPGNRFLWFAALACLASGGVLLLTNGSPIALILFGLSCLALYLVAFFIVDASLGADASSSLDDVINQRW